MRTTLNIDLEATDRVVKLGGFTSRSEAVNEALRESLRRFALKELAEDIGHHPRAFVEGYDPEAGEQ